MLRWNISKLKFIFSFQEIAFPSIFQIGGSSQIYFYASRADPFMCYCFHVPDHITYHISLRWTFMPILQMKKKVMLRDWISCWKRQHVIMEPGLLLTSQEKLDHAYVNLKKTCTSVGRLGMNFFSSTGDWNYMNLHLKSFCQKKIFKSCKDTILWQHMTSFG